MDPYTKAAKALDSAASSKPADASAAAPARNTGEKNSMQQTVEKMSPREVDDQNRKAMEFANRNKRVESKRSAGRSSGRGR